MQLLNIYRISDFSNPTKVKPSYASKENCLRVFIREFGSENLLVVGDGITESTHEMLKKYVPEENILLTDVGNTGAFLTSIDLAYRIALEHSSEDFIFYFIEDDYIHRRGAKQILLEAFSDLDADYVTLYDHPDKYQDMKDSRYITGQGVFDDEEDGVRKPRVLYKAGEHSKITISRSTHWRTVSSTTMTWATTGKNLKEDYEDLMKLHTGKELPMGISTFEMLRTKEKHLISPIPSYSAHAEEKWLPYFINWQIEAEV